MTALALPSPRTARPLLKWAGGKRQLLPAISQHYPAHFARYIEPFVGSGAVFFDLHASGRLIGKRAWLLDDNPDLVGCYQMLRDRTAAVIAALAKFDRQHRRRGPDFYYEIRDERFNPARAAGAAYTPELAAMLIYLNRTGFNGLFRLNRQGAFNVPVGRYENPRICDPDHLRDVAAALRASDVVIERDSFERPLREAGPGDFVYCDPPYAPLTPTSNFAHYTAAGFDANDQERLCDAIVKAARRGAAIVLSNSCTPELEALYGGAEARRAGLVLQHVDARRAINSRASSRGPVKEILVSNARIARLTMKPAALRAAPRPRTRACIA